MAEAFTNHSASQLDLFALDDIKMHVESEQDEFYDSLDGCIDIS